MSEIVRIDEQSSIEIITKVPRWFFAQSLPPGTDFRYREVPTDVGFAQRTSIEEDLPATVRALEGLYPLRDVSVKALARELREGGADVVVCDIAAVGIASAKEAGIPSVLVENFTWDLIYQPYFELAPDLEQFARYLAPLYEEASVRIQASPVCREVTNAYRVAPIARAIRCTSDEVRNALKVPPDSPLVMLSMGGVPGDYPFLAELGDVAAVTFIVAGASAHDGLPKNVRVLPHQSPLYHPDVIGAADAVVGKTGYSTVAEAYFGRTQFFFVPRPRFPESPVMERFVSAELEGVEISAASFASGEWLKKLESSLRDIEPLDGSIENGSCRAADIIVRTARRGR
jgi:hypothetical protein